MAADIGARIGIEGEGAFRDSLGAINSQIKALGSEMREATTRFGDMGDSQQAAAAKSDILKRAIAANQQKIDLLTSQSDRAKQKLNALGEEAERAAQEFGENSTQAIKAQNAYNRQARAVNNLESQISDATSESNRMGKELETLGKKDKKLNKLRDAGKNLGDTFKAAFSGAAIAGLIQSLGGALSNLMDSTAEYRKIMGTLAVSSEKAGYSVQQTDETFRQLYGVLGDEQTAATATANLQALGLEQNELTQLTKGAIGAWATYGDSIPIDGLSEAINETVKTGKVTGAFADVLNWAGGEEDAFNKKLEQAADKGERANLVLEALSSQGLTDAADSWSQTNSAIENANIAQLNFQDTMAGFAEVFSPMVTSVKEGVNGILDGLLQLVQIGQEEGLGGMLDFLTESIVNFTQQLPALMPELLEQGSGIVTSIFQGISESLPGLLEAGRELIGTVVLGILESLPDLANSAQELIVSFLGFLTEKGPEMLKGGKEMLKQFITGVLDAIPAFVEQLPAIISAFLEFVLTSIPAVLEAGADMLLHLAKGIIETIPKLVEQLPEIIRAITGTIREKIPDVISAGFDILKGLIDGIINAIPDLIENLPQVLTAIYEGLKEGIEGVFGIGGDIIQGLWNGMKDMADWLKQKVKGFGNGVLNAIESVFGINSPSRVMREEVGQMLAQGMALGLKDDGQVAIDAAEEIAHGVTGAMKELDGATESVKRLTDALWGKNMTDANVFQEADITPCITFARRTAGKVGKTLEKELDKVSVKLEKMETQAAKEKEAAQLASYQDSLKKKYEELEKAETKNKQAILDSIEKLESDWNQKQLDAANAADKERLEAQKKSLQEQLTAQKEALEAFEQEYQSHVEAIESKQSSMADTLMSYGSLFQTVKDETGEELFQLGDIQGEIDKITAYGQALDQLAQKSLPEDFMEEITAMGVDDGLGYMNILLSKSDQALEQYIELFEQKQKIAGEIAEKYYKTELSALESQFKVDSGAIEGIQETFTQSGADAAESFSEGLQSQGALMGEIVETAVVDALAQGSGAAGENTVGAVIHGLTGKEPVLMSYVTGLKDRLIDFMEGFYTEFQQIGQLFMEGVTEGIKDGQSGLVNTMIRTLQAAVRAAREEMDIHSPSGVFREIGGYMAQGLDQGWKSQMKNLEKSMQSSMKTLSAIPDVSSSRFSLSPKESAAYTYGDINLYIDKVENSNGRDVETLARELEFLRRRRDMAKGGGY